MINSRQLVIDTLEFNNTLSMVPKEMWTLPWVFDNYMNEYENITSSIDFDIVRINAILKEKTIEQGDAYEIGDYIDPWGCTFRNIHKGIIGEVKEPIVLDEDWCDKSKIHIPEELISFDIQQVNEECEKNKDKFKIAGFFPRPFEQLQFIRGTEELYIDLMLEPKGMLDFIEKMQNFYCRLLTKWAKTDVDALFFMDDWGTQLSLLINPEIWVRIFKPLYKDYIDIAHKYGKKIFMHSDGNILEILPHLVELGLDAINCQIFCMDMNELAKYKGKITFWGEMDRQHILPHGNIDDVKKAVDLVYNHLWDNGGCIAQCEFGPGAKPENVFELFKYWDTKKISI